MEGHIENEHLMLSYHGIWTIRCKKDNSTRCAHAFVSYICFLYIPHEAWAIVCYFLQSSPELHDSGSNSSHAFSLYRYILKMLSLGAG